MPDDDTEELTDEERFEAWYQDRKAKDEKEAARKKPPKDFGDAVDRIADAVLDKLDARAQERAAAREAEDEEPTRGERGTSGFLKMLGG